MSSAKRMLVRLVVCGSSWRSADPLYTRGAARCHVGAGGRNGYLGLRLARRAP